MYYLSWPKGVFSAANVHGHTGICLAYGISVRSLRQVRRYQMPSATQHPLWSLFPSELSRFLCFSYFICRPNRFKLLHYHYRLCFALPNTIFHHKSLRDWAVFFLPLFEGTVVSCNEKHSSSSLRRMSFACVCVINEPLCLPTGAHRDAVKDGSGTGYMAPFRDPKSVVIGGSADWLLFGLNWGVRNRERGQARRGTLPTGVQRPFGAAAFHLIAFCCSALDFASAAFAFTHSFKCIDELFFMEPFLVCHFHITWASSLPSNTL